MSSEARSLRSKRRAVDRSHEAAIAHLAICVAHRDKCELELKNFCKQHSVSSINSDPLLFSRHIELITAKSEAWEAYFKAHKEANPKTIEDLLWIMAKAGHTELIAPLMNLSKATRECIHLQPIMMNVEMRGLTQLHYCSAKGLTSGVIRLLSIRNIDVNAKDRYGMTPLHFAARKGHVEITRRLIQSGSIVDARNARGDTPLYTACNTFYINQSPTQHLETIRLLIESGALINSKDNDGDSPLRHALGKDCPLEIVKYLVDMGANVLDRGYLDVPLLHWASHEGLGDIVQLFIQKGADVNATINTGETALLWAAQKGSVDVLHHLAKNGADLEAFDEDGWTAMHFAVCMGHLPFIKELVLKYEVDINPEDFLHGKTTLTVAFYDLERQPVAKESIEIVDFLTANGGVE